MMNSNLKYHIFVVLSTYGFIVWGSDACKVCDKYENINVCIVSTMWGIQNLGRALGTPGACGRESQIHIVPDRESIHTILSKAAESCQKISRLTFFGHGSDYKMTLGGVIETHEWKQFSKYSCVVSENAFIDTRGCNVGKGCEGAIQMYRIGNAFFGEKKGRILSPTNYIAAIGRPEALFGKDRTMEYSKSNLIYGVEGAVGDVNSEIRYQCISELDEISRDLAELMSTFGNESCKNKLPKEHLCMGIGCVQNLDSQILKVNNLRAAAKNLNSTDLVKYLSDTELSGISSLENLKKSIALTSSQLIYYCAGNFSKHKVTEKIRTHFIGEPGYTPFNFGNK